MEATITARRMKKSPEARAYWYPVMGRYVNRGRFYDTKGEAVAEARKGTETAIELGILPADTVITER